MKADPLIHVHVGPLPMTLKTSFRSAKEVIHSQGETLYLYLHPNKTKTTDQNTQEGMFHDITFESEQT